MSAESGFERLRREELFARLAAGHASRIAVVTPNRRLAAALMRDFDAHQAARGLVRWETPDILPLTAFVDRLYQDALYSDIARQLPLLLQPAQEHALWEAAIRASTSGRSLLAVTGAASLARDAWQTAHEWRLVSRLKDYPANDDARAFAEWMSHYERAAVRLRRTDRARLPDVVAPHLAHKALRKPAVLVACGFDLPATQQREFLKALENAGTALLDCGHDNGESASCRVGFDSAKEEFQAAARWARARLEASPQARIGVVVPNLQQSRHQVRRIFMQTLAPASCLPGQPARALPFDISLGEPLTAYPIVADALRLFDLARSEMDFSSASCLLRSPFIGGAESEASPRARLDAELRTAAGARIDLERLRRAIARISADDSAHRVPRCSNLSLRLDEISAFAREQLGGSRIASEWARAFSALLEAAGFPGERGLDSVEYQALKKFHEAIAGFAALDAVAGRMRFEDARARLAHMLADTLFQPEAPEAPIRILGILESAGLEFDHLWVTGMSEEAWPMPARPNPFLPIALQRAAGVPEASAAASLALDQRITRGWRIAAGEVVMSHSWWEDDRKLLVSPLIADASQVSIEDLRLPEFDALRDVIRRSRREERIADSRAPVLGSSSVEAGDALTLPASGGTGVFADQAACPFRAFAVHRLGARDTGEPSPGPDGAERGTLLHAMLAAVWDELKSKARLDAMADGELDSLLNSAAEQALARLRRRRPDAVTRKFAELEKARLARLASAWLDEERKRPAFEVREVESKRVLRFGGISVRARLDRVDKLAGGGHAVIDYKTSAASTGGWWGARPDEPQLPLYATGGQEEIAAVVFARVKAGDMAFKGVSRDPGQFPGVKTLAGQRTQAAKRNGSWPGLLAAWKRELDALGCEFASGEARVAPKRGEATCRNCQLRPLCRINERAPNIGGGETDAEGE